MNYRWVLGISAAWTLACGGLAPEPQRPPPTPVAPKPVVGAPPAEPVIHDAVSLLAGGYTNRLTAKCQASGSPLCSLLERTGAAGELGDGSRVGLALPCHDVGGYRAGAALEAAANGDWSHAELAILRLDGGSLQVSSLRGDNPEEDRILAALRTSLVACLGSRTCSPATTPAVLAAARAPDVAARRPSVDRHGHLNVASPVPDDLTWDVGRSILAGREWIVVGEARPNAVLCEWVDLFPLEPLPSGGAAPRDRRPRRR